MVGLSPNGTIGRVVGLPSCPVVSSPFEQAFEFDVSLRSLVWRDHQVALCRWCHGRFLR
jgi:hypothetical protein